MVGNKNKKYIFLSLAITLILTFSCLISYAEDSSTNKVMVNGKYLVLDVPPVIVNGRLLVPLRAIFEVLGATVEWDENTRTVTAAKGKIKIELGIENSSAKVNGKSVKLDSPAKIINNRTVVPVRFVSESMGAKVTWDAKNKTAIVNTSSAISIKIYYPNSNNLMYEGEVKNNIPHGQGKKYHSNGKLEYQGGFVDGLFDGYGKSYTDKGIVTYAGYWKHSAQDGIGQSYKNNILEFDGSWKDGQPHGYGKFYEISNRSIIYDGNWQNGVFIKGKSYNTQNNLKTMYDGTYGGNFSYHGSGNLYINNMFAYEGTFKDNLFSGKGKAYFKNGNLAYEGDFLEGKFNGTGKSYLENGDLVYEGDFKNGLLDGTGNIFVDGLSTICLFSEGYSSTTVPRRVDETIFKWNEQNANILILLLEPKKVF